MREAQSSLVTGQMATGGMHTASGPGQMAPYSGLGQMAPYSGLGPSGSKWWFN